MLISIGNDILGDDAAGFIIGDKLGELLKTENNRMNSISLDMLDLMTGGKNLILIDTVCVPGKEIGLVFRFDLDEFDEYIHLTSPHSINVPTMLKLAGLYGNVPENIHLYGINIENKLVFSENLSPELESKVNSITDYIYRDYLKDRKADNE